MNSKQKRIAKQLENQHISPDRLRKNMDAERHPEEQDLEAKDYLNMRDQQTKVNGSARGIDEPSS